MEADTLTHKRCSRCKEHKPTTEFNNNPKASDGFRAQCKGCLNEIYVERCNAKPQWYRFLHKKANAKTSGIDFDLQYDELEWPVHCPVLGLELDYSFGKRTGVPPNSPSFDRIDPNMGYVRGNVIIVSHLANAIKTNATVDQLKKVAAFYEQLIPQGGSSHV